MATSDEPSNAPSAAPPTPAAPASQGVSVEAPKPRRLIVRMLLPLGLSAGLFGLAFVASWQVRVLTADPSEFAGAPTEPGTPFNKKAERGGDVVEMLARGDQALLGHHFSEALSHYAEILEGAPSGAPLVNYRIGLCNEALGQSQKAVACYRTAITTSTSPTLSFACRLGIARCLLLTNNPIEARQALYPMLLNESKQQGMSHTFLAEARYLAALALARETHPATTDRLGLDRLASFTEAGIDVPFYLEETAKPLPLVKEAPVAAPPVPIVVEKRVGEKPAVALSVIHLGKPAKELFDKLAGDAGWRLDWTTAATKNAQERLLDLHVRNWPLLELLELTADHLDLTCQLDGETLRISTGTELEAPKAAVLKCEMAQRALKTAIGIDPSHPLTASATIELANWHAGAGKSDEALIWYERLIREEPSSACVGLAYYNRAQLRLRNQAFLQARRDYYRTIDQAPGHEVALRAYLRLGQLALEDEGEREAIPLFRRAQTLAPGSAYQPLAALHLAATMISIGQPDQARAALQAHRMALRQPPYQATAVFLDAYANYQLAKATKPSQREATDLLGVMWQSQDGTLLGSFGQNLIAQAYDELGFPDQAERMLRQALAGAHTKTSLAAHLELKLGEALLKQDQRDKAQPLFEKVASTSYDHGTLARFQLARLDLHDKRWKECAARCRALWEEKSHVEPIALLQMWGFALEGLGDYTRAAQCFAGKTPE